VFQTGSVGTDGMTFTLWENDAAMAEAAYRPGIHRTQLERYKMEQTADHSSFTRERIPLSSGRGMVLPFPDHT
jgi:hypothetical protein